MFYKVCRQDALVLRKFKKPILYLTKKEVNRLSFFANFNFIEKNIQYQTA